MTFLQLDDLMGPMSWSVRTVKVTLSDLSHVPAEEMTFIQSNDVTYRAPPIDSTGVILHLLLLSFLSSVTIPTSACGL